MRLPLLLVLLVLGCGSAPDRKDPVTGRAYSSPIGNDYASQDEYVRKNYLTQTSLANDGGMLPEPEIVAACGKIFEDIVLALPPEHRRDFEFHFFVTCSPGVNAYTYGGGRVHCWLGLVADCRDASEFAGVLAHEVGHISHDHVGQQLGRAERFDRITSLGGVLGGPGRTLTQSIGGLFGAPIIMSHSRAQEREADDRAVEYTRAAGYDPDGLARWFERLASSEKGGVQFLSSHPSSSGRVAKIRARIAAQGGAPATAPATEAAYQRAHARARAILPYYVEMNRSLGSEDLDRIMNAAEAGVRDLPAHGQFHFWKGIVLTIRKRHKEALAALVTAERLDPANVLFAYILAALAFEQEAWPEAEQGAGHTIALIPALPAAWLIRGLARYKQGRKEQGFADLDVVVKAVQPHKRAELMKEIRKYAPDYPGPAS